jgi:hypothetical protein
VVRAALIRQQALVIPEEVSGQALLTEWETRLRDFTAYFDQRWQGNMFEESQEKEADLECLVRLQARVATQKVQMQSKASLADKNPIESGIKGMEKSRDQLEQEAHAAEMTNMQRNGKKRSY